MPRKISNRNDARSYSQDSYLRHTPQYKVDGVGSDDLCLQLTVRKKYNHKDKVEKISIYQISG